MPQVIVEYTENLAGFPTAEVLRVLNQRLIACGEFQPHDIKSRAVCVRDFLVADGDDAHAFVHVSLSILSGRSQATKAAISQSLMGALQTLLAPMPDLTLQLSIEVRDMERAVYSKSSV